jgi:hypothetical protein
MLIRAINGLGLANCFNAQIPRMGEGLELKPELSFLPTTIRVQKLDQRQARSLAARI